MLLFFIIVIIIIIFFYSIWVALKLLNYWFTKITKFSICLNNFRNNHSESLKLIWGRPGHTATVIAGFQSEWLTASFLESLDIWLMYNRTVVFHITTSREEKTAESKDLPKQLFGTYFHCSRMCVGISKEIKDYRK